MTKVLDIVEQATSLLAAAACVDRASLSDTDLVALLAAEEAAGRLLGASQVLTAAEVADRSRYELGTAGLSMRYSQRKAVDFIEEVTRVSKTEATRRVRVGEAVRPRLSMIGEVLAPARPAVAEAMTSGLLGIDAADTILRSLRQAASGCEATPENLDAAESALVEAGAMECADAVADLGRLWRDALDPDGIEPRYEEIRQRRGVFIGRERNGITRFTINAAPTLAAELGAVFIDSMDPNALPRFLSDDDRAKATTLVENEDGVLVERVVDPRSIEQKRADILEGVLLAGLRATSEGPASLRTIGTVTAIIQLTDLENGTGYGILEGTNEVLPASAIQELACESGFYKILVGSRGEPLYHSRLLRYFTQAQRRAMIARDGDRCIAMGCRRPASACHAHHLIFHSQDGPTDVDNGTNHKYYPQLSPLAAFRATHSSLAPGSLASGARTGHLDRYLKTTFVRSLIFMANPVGALKATSRRRTENPRTILAFYATVVGLLLAACVAGGTAILATGRGLDLRV